MPETIDPAEMLAIRLGFGLGPGAAHPDGAAMLASVGAVQAGDGTACPSRVCQDGRTCLDARGVA